MKKLILLFNLVLAFGYLFSQVSSFGSGRIITKEHDTLNVLVGIEVNYNRVVSYKSNINSDIQYMKIENIESVITPYNRLENILIKNKEQLYRVVVSGKCTLLQQVFINQGSSYEASGGTTSLFSAPTIYYAIKINDEVISLKKKKDKSQLLPFLKEYPEVSQMLENKSFGLDDLEKVVERLNAKL